MAWLEVMSENLVCWAWRAATAGSMESTSTVTRVRTWARRDGADMVLSGVYSADGDRVGLEWEGEGGRRGAGASVGRGRGGQDGPPPGLRGLVPAWPMAGATDRRSRYGGGPMICGVGTVTCICVVELSKRPGPWSVDCGGDTAGSTMVNKCILRALKKITKARRTRQAAHLAALAGGVGGRSQVRSAPGASDSVWGRRQDREDVQAELPDLWAG